MGVEGYDTFTPVELDLHESVEVSIVFGAWKIVVSLDVSICLRLDSGEEICDFIGSVVVDVSEGFDF